MDQRQGVLQREGEEPVGEVERDTRLKKFLWPPRDRECKAVILGELNKIDQAMRKVGRREVVVQGGGNCGVFPHYLAGLFERVYTFEPDPENFHYLTRNATAENVIKIQGALGSEPKLVRMTGTPVNCGAYQVREGGTIPTFRIDDLGLEACDFLCLDVEGSEYEALQGARLTLTRFHPAILYEDKGIGTEKDEIGRWLSEEFDYETQRLPRDVVAW